MPAQEANSRPNGRAASRALDCVVASIGDEAITQSDLMDEIRLEQFLNGDPAGSPPDPAALDRVRERLIERKLLLEEAEALGSSSKEIEAAARQVWEDARKRYSAPEAFQAALGSLGVDEAQVMRGLVDEQKVLALIDRRLRPQAAVEPPDIEAYYRDRFTPEFKKKGSGKLPPLPEVEGQIREILIQERIDGLLAQWMEELKTSHRVVLHSFCDHEPS